MADPHVEKMAQVLVRYSLALKPGDLFRIIAPPAAVPLVRALYKEALLAGANPYLAMTLEETDELLLCHGSDAQIGYVSPMMRQEIEEINATIRIMASENTRALSGIDPRKVALRRQALSDLQKRVMQRSAEGTLNWCVTLFPTNAAAQDADMSLSDFEEFVYRACKLHYNDPVAEWRRTLEEQQRIADFLNTCSVIRLVAPDTDLTYRVAGRTWINCAGDRNFPDGEVFSSCDETATEGYIRYTFPAIYAGREVEDIRLWFEDGKVVKATAAKGEDLLHSLLAMDEGARRLGEVAFGTNYDITRFSRNILFDEKIGGTVHLALGAGYPETGSRNTSALHWDMICDMRQGEAYADGRLIYKEGKFLI
ncbi:MAG: aminopeptidase [Roseiflexus castenholzii]|uniref:aminopeptidase n=1 Tax=Roseiflexus castenholzii TaxID=120962 RepID=UPI000CB9C0CA|nr:MAG: aminopeptidase [Roseiflexus castenholzii]